MARNNKSKPLRVELMVAMTFDENGVLRSFEGEGDTPEEVEQLQDILERTQRQSAARIANRVNAAPTEEPTGLALEDAIEQYLSSDHIKPTTRKTYKSRLAKALEHFGGQTNARSLEQADLSAFAARTLDATHDASTATLYISTFSGMLNWFRVREGWGAPLTTQKLLPKKKTPEADDRDGFTLSQLAAIFANVSKYRDTEPAKYWVSVAVAFLGCRIEELAQVELPHNLHCNDTTGIWYLDLNGRADADGIVRKSMKNTASWRQVPLHSALVRLGFVTYLQDQVKAGYSRPFECQWKAYSESGEGGIQFKWSHYITNWGGRELNKMRIAGTLPPGLQSYFHSMRHSFSHIMNEARVPADIIEAALGHDFARGDRERYTKMKRNPALLSREGIEPGLAALAALFANQEPAVITEQVIEVPEQPALQ